MKTVLAYLNTGNFDVYNLTFEFPAEIFVLIRCYSWFSMHQISTYFGIFQIHLSVCIRYLMDNFSAQILSAKTKRKF